ncbi:PACE efflux transporter [Desulfovibrio sp. JC022]|uniref:PACE efflux transporter n=1 Tax=Desulfovibrio sp. JC022 TaxID=2593642 RepID=UPI0013D118C9|nr:PACE efflux transporter [Desulfovibrio sp. JC022]NDV22454.1 PACE efflux transporter [Desulfovibrio sp. JC022]
MRTSKDRLRHTILFEIVLVLLIGPLLSVMLGKSLHTMGVITITLSLIAMVVNYFYNLAFDYALLRLGRPVYERGPKLRVLHSVFFELCLLVFSLPLVMLLLDYSFMQALMLDLGFAMFVPVYAFFFNVIYDRTFPVVAVQ